MIQEQYDLSVIMPAYNEEAIIEDSLLYIINFLKNKNIPLFSNFEIIVINDGSTDSTKQIIESIVNHHDNIKIISSETNMGLGSAVKQGVLKAKGKYLLICDADLYALMSVLKDTLTDYNSKDFSILVGTRKKYNKSIIRKTMHDAYILISNFFLKTNLKDIQCGFKLLNTAVAKQVFDKVKNNHYFYSTELLYYARKLKFPIDEIAIPEIHEIRCSKVNCFRDSVRVLFALISFYCKNAISYDEQRKNEKIEDCN